MQKIVITKDGSSSIQLADIHVQYHSDYGAIQEAKHVYIDAGLQFTFSKINRPISIFEMGFGTGLNCFLTFLEAKKQNRIVNYTTVEAFPVDFSLIQQLNFAQSLGVNADEFHQFHHLTWSENHQVDPYFSFLKLDQIFQDYSALPTYDLIYYDAFGARAYPELWTKTITDKLFCMLNAKGAIVTYSVFGEFRRNLLDSGFWVEKIVGPPGKREMLRAIKLPC